MTRLSDFNLTIEIPKIARSNGFNQRLEDVDEWMAFQSTKLDTRLWVRPTETEQLYVAVHPAEVVDATSSSLKTSQIPPMPPGASRMCIADDLNALYELLDDVYARSRALDGTSSSRPSVLETFEQRTHALPQTTEAERVVVQRIGQDLFRDALLHAWNGRCAVTHLDIPELLRASHIKPWAACDTSDERLDPYNGLLLAPHLDLAFDQGFITFTSNGTLRPSDRLSQTAMQQLGVREEMQLRRVEPQHVKYLEWHWERVFLG